MDLSPRGSVGFCRGIVGWAAVKERDRQVNLVDSMFVRIITGLQHAGTPFALLESKVVIRRLASRGGWNSTSTEIPVFGGSVLERGGLHQPPFSFAGCVLVVVSSQLPWVVLILS